MVPTIDPDSAGRPLAPKEKLSWLRLARSENVGPIFVNETNQFAQVAASCKDCGLRTNWRKQFDSFDRTEVEVQ